VNRLGSLVTGLGAAVGAGERKLSEASSRWFERSTSDGLNTGSVGFQGSSMRPVDFDGGSSISRSTGFGWLDFGTGGGGDGSRLCGSSGESDQVGVRGSYSDGGRAVTG